MRFLGLAFRNGVTVSVAQRKFRARGKSLARLFRMCAVLGVGLATVGSASASNNVPDWVHDAVSQPLGKLPEKTKAVVLLDETTYTVGADGKAVTHYRSVIKILRPQGRESAMPRLWFDKDSKILSFHVWSIDPSGHEYALKDNEIREYGSPGDGILYSDERARVAEPPGMDAGGVVAYEYEKRERPYLAETNWWFQGDLPELKQSFTLVLPAGFSYTTTWAHHAKADGADLENHKYRWEMNNEPAIDMERVPLAPSPESLAGRMTVHYAGPGIAIAQEGTWQGIGVWYENLSRDRLAASPEISAKAAELIAGKNDFYDKAEAIGEFVQKQIRYFAIEMGIGGYQPHAAAEIFRARYGDCKDKATLLSAMLSSVGIHSALLMVDSRRGVIDPLDPSIAGNHMIGAIEIPVGYESPKFHSVVTAKTGKRYLIFDPTWEETPFGQVEDNLQGSYGLLVEGKDSEAIQVPVLAPELNRIEKSASFQLSADGVLTGTVQDRRAGDVASYRRAVFMRDDAQKQQEYIDRTVSRDLPSASLTGLKVDNIDQLNKELTTSFHIEAAHYGMTTGPLLMVRPRVFGTYAMEVDRKDRKVGIDLDSVLRATDEFDITLPEGYVIDELPDPVKVDFGFAAYESKTELRGKTLHYTRTYTRRAVVLPPEKYGDLQKLSSLIATDEESRAVLKRAP